MNAARRNERWFGAIVLTIVSTICLSTADAFTKLFSGSYHAPQLFALSGGIVAFISFVQMRTQGTSLVPTRSAIWLLGVRSVFVILSCCSYYYSFKNLPFHEVFLFIGIVPVFTAVFGVFILGERPNTLSRGALLVGVLGVFMIFPVGDLSIIPTHLVALCASFCAAISISVCRKITQVDDRSELQVFYTNGALSAVMICVLPFVFIPMGLQDVLVVLLYSVALYFARILLVNALRQLPAFIVTLLMNVQFVWMLLISVFVFGGDPSTQSLLGAGIIICSGLVITMSELKPRWKIFQGFVPRNI